MGTWTTDPSSGMQTWQAALLPEAQWDVPYINSEFGNYWGAPTPTYDKAVFPGGGTNSDYPAGSQIGIYGDPSGGSWQKLNDGYWYYHTPGGNVEISGGGQVYDSGTWDLSRRMDQSQMSSYASKYGEPLQTLTNPGPSQGDIWESPLTGLEVFLGGLGAIGALPGVASAIGDWAGSLGAAEAGAGALDAGLSAAGMGGADLAGWGGITEGAGGLDLLGNAASGALPGLEGLELGGEGVGQAASSVGTEFADPSIVDLFNNAGTPGFNNIGQSYESLVEELFNRAGTPGFTQYGDPATGLDWLRSYLPSNTSSLSSTARSGLSRLLGIPDNVAGGALGLLSWLAARDQRNNQASQNASNVAALRSPAFNAPLNPTAFAGPQMRNVMGATPSTPRQNVTPTWNQPIRRAEGGALSRMSNNTAGPSMGGYAAGGTKGQDDKIPALLSDGEYVFDADSVAALGDGNNAAGAAVLDKMRENIRRHKRSAPANKIPPKAKSPEAYMKGAK